MVDLFIQKYDCLICFKACFLESYNPKDNVISHGFLSVFRGYETQDHSARTPENVYIPNGRCRGNIFWIIYFQEKIRKAIKV